MALIQSPVGGGDLYSAVRVAQLKQVRNHDWIDRIDRLWSSGASCHVRQSIKKRHCGR